MVWWWSDVMWWCGVVVLVDRCDVVWSGGVGGVVWCGVVVLVE